MDNESRVLEMYAKLRKSMKHFVLCELAGEFVIVVAFSLALAFAIDTSNTRALMIWFLLLMVSLGACMLIMLKIFFGSPKGFTKVSKFVSTVDWLQKQIKDAKANEDSKELNISMTIYREEIDNLAKQIDEFDMKKS